MHRNGTIYCPYEVPEQEGMKYRELESGEHGVHPHQQSFPPNLEQLESVRLIKTSR
jgi:hypothetical protein